MTDSTGLHQYEFDRVLRCMLCARCGAAMSAAIPLCPGKKKEEPSEKSVLPKK